MPFTIKKNKNKNVPQCCRDRTVSRKDTCNPLYHAVSVGFLKHGHHSRSSNLFSPKIQNGIKSNGLTIITATSEKPKNKQRV